jgi:hypothetical protein
MDGTRPTTSRSLRQWLRELGSVVPRLRGIDRRVDEFVEYEDWGDPDWTPETPVRLGDAGTLLERLGHLADHAYDWKRYRGVVASGLWFDDSTDMFCDQLASHLGLRGGFDDVVDTDPSDPLDGFNRSSGDQGLARRLFRVDGHPDYDVVLCLEPAEYEALLRQGLVPSPKPRPETFVEHAAPRAPPRSEAPGATNLGDTRVPNWVVAVVIAALVLLLIVPAVVRALLG